MTVCERLLPSKKVWHDAFKKKMVFIQHFPVNNMFVIKIFVLSDNTIEGDTVSAWLATVSFRQCWTGCFEAPYRALVVSLQVDQDLDPDHQSRLHCQRELINNQPETVSQLILTITWWSSHRYSTLQLRNIINTF